jgi:hypothetical protein
MYRVCVCCGEKMSEKVNPLSRNPNVCASCSSMADGMEDLPKGEELIPAEPVASEAELSGQPAHDNLHKAA